MKFNYLKHKTVNEFQFGMTKVECQDICSDQHYNVYALNERRNPNGVTLEFSDTEKLKGIYLYHPSQIEIFQITYNLPNDIQDLIEVETNRIYFHLGIEIFKDIGLAMRGFTGDCEDLEILMHDGSYFSSM